MSATTYGWITLACPLAGMLVISLGYRFWRGRMAGLIGTLAILLAFAAAIGALIKLQQEPSGHRELVSSIWNYAVTSGVNGRMAILVDPLSVFMILVVSG